MSSVLKDVTLSSAPVIVMSAVPLSMSAVPLGTQDLQTNSGKASPSGKTFQSDPIQVHKTLYKEPATRISRWEQPAERNKRVNGWGSPSSKTFTPSAFSYFPREMSLLEIEVWMRRHRIDDLQRRISEQDYEANDADIRSPSPEPIYDAKTGLRSNTRDQRLKDRYYKERLRLIDEVLEMDPSYEPPPDYKPPKKQRKIMIPDPNNPQVNYIGQIIGPSGTTQQKLERESKCKIQIRGKGAQNNKAMRIFDPDEQLRSQSTDDEPLHVLVTADKEDELERGCQMIEAILNQTDEAKKLQVVVFDHLTRSKVWCESCGLQGHKFYDCPEKQLLNSASIFCDNCGSRTHPTSDCPSKQRQKQGKNGKEGGFLAIEDNPDEELYQFMRKQKDLKEEAQKMKMLTYEAPDNAVADQFYDQEGNAQMTESRDQDQSQSPPEPEETEQSSLSKSLFQAQFKHMQNKQQTQMAAQSSFKAYNAETNVQPYIVLQEQIMNQKKQEKPEETQEEGENKDEKEASGSVENEKSQEVEQNEPNPGYDFRALQQLQKQYSNQFEMQQQQYQYQQYYQNQYAAAQGHYGYDYAQQNYQQMQYHPQQYGQPPQGYYQQPMQGHPQMQGQFGYPQQPPPQEYYEEAEQQPNQNQEPQNIDQNQSPPNNSDQ